MKKLVFIFFILFTLTIATGCNARRNTVHFDPQIDELSDSVETTEDEVSESTEIVAKGPEFSIKSPELDNGQLNTNVNYHVIKGSTPKNTDSITVNDYKLTKYYPGQIEWSYIVSTSIGTLVEGENEYIVRAYDKDGNEIGGQDFTVIYEAAEIPELPSVGLNIWLVFAFSLLISGLFFGFTRLRKVCIKK